MSQAPRRTSRREVLGWSLAAGAAALLNPRLPFAVAKEPGAKADAPIPGRGAAKQMIVLYMAGGATQFEDEGPCWSLRNSSFSREEGTCARRTSSWKSGAAGGGGGIVAGRSVKAGAFCGSTWTWPSVLPDESTA